MKYLNKLVFFIILIFLLVSLTGCMNKNENLDINKENSKSGISQPSNWKNQINTKPNAKEQINTKSSWQDQISKPKAWNE